MPYINREDRVRALDFSTSPGELNYALTMLAIQCVVGVLNASQFGLEVLRTVESYLKRMGPRSYNTFNEIMGVLTCMPMELERRLQDNDLSIEGIRIVKKQTAAYREIFYVLSVAPYEDEKIKINGDVYPEELT